MREDGFINEKLYVIPKDMLLKHNDFYVTDVGFFPLANDHYTARPEGTSEHIIMICVGGKGYVNYKEVETNSLVFIPKNLKHLYRSSRTSPWDIYWIHFQGENPYKNDKEVSIISLSKFQIRSLSDMFLNILDSFEHGITETQISFINNSMKYMITLIDYYLLEPPKLPKVVRRANKFVKKDLAQNYSIDDICDELSISNTTLYNAYKSHYNIPPNLYFTQLKMEVASNYLISTTMKIFQISKRLGYEDPYYFSRIFKKTYGSSPRQYRLDNT